MSGGWRTCRDAKSGRENSGEDWYTITKGMRTLNLGCDGGMKLAQVHASIKLLSITLQCLHVCGGWLKKIHLLN